MHGNCSRRIPGAPHGGFTLVELIIVVAVIAILAAIGIPNLLDAQTRSKVAAAKSDMRTLATALEAYAADNHHYPSAGRAECMCEERLLNPVSRRFMGLTTPVAYLTHAPPREAFPAARSWPGDDNVTVYDTYDYLGADSASESGSGITSGGEYRIASAGPDLYMAFGGRTVMDPTASEAGVDYDPTNGTVSQGDIVRVGPLHTRNGDPFDPNNIRRPGIVRVPVYVEQWR